MKNIFEKFPPQSKCWIYQASREINFNEEKNILSEGKKFVADWKAHGKNLEAEFEILYSRFIIIIADENIEQASGCSIDTSVYFIKEHCEKYSIDFFDRTNIAYKNADEKISTFYFLQAEKYFSEGKIFSDTIIFNNSVSTKHEWETAWMLPLQDSFLKKIISQHIQQI